MAATRPVKDKQKEMSERHQAVLSELLKDEDNKYCVDCDAKGPRWASWNLGVFLCIRCAGIHRNLGVHISRVKSVNLDSWTSEQVSTMEDMGNSKARAIYEANLPDGYKRPQTDSALEQFIRAKYEQKKWIAKEWNPQQKQQPRPQSRTGESESTVSESKRRETKSAASSASTAAAAPSAVGAATMKATASSSSLTAAGASPQQVSVPAAGAAALPKSGSQGVIGQQPQKASANVDLLGGIDTSPQIQAPSDRSVAASSVDLLADIFGGAVAEAPTTFAGVGSGSGAAGAKNDLFLAAEDKSKSQKDSIMALYGAGSTGMAASPAVYGTGVYSATVQGMSAGAYGVPGGYAPLPATVPAASVVPQPGMPMMVGVQPMASAVMYPGMMVAPVVQQTPVMVNGFAPGYYTQQQHAYLAASQQLPQQIAAMSLGGQGGFVAQAQPQLQRQAQQSQAANGGMPGWADSSSATAATKTLDFSLWH